MKLLYYIPVISSFAGEQSRGELNSHIYNSFSKKTPPDLEKSQGAKNETMSEIFSVAEDAIDKHHDIGDGHDTIVVEVGVPFVNAQ